MSHFPQAHVPECSNYTHVQTIGIKRTVCSQNDADDNSPRCLQSYIVHRFHNLRDGRLSHSLRSILPVKINAAYNNNHQFEISRVYEEMKSLNLWKSSMKGCLTPWRFMDQSYGVCGVQRDKKWMFLRWNDWALWGVIEYWWVCLKEMRLWMKKYTEERV